MNNGWISLNRKITNNWLWKDKPFSKGQAWIDILLMVNHKENKVLFRDELINVERGERITSQVKLSDRWGWSRGKVRKFLTMLENDNMLVVRTDKRKTVLKVVNYNVYQDNNNSKSQQIEQEKDKRTSKRKPREKQETEQEATTNNNVNNVNNENNENNDNNKDPSINDSDDKPKEQKNIAIFNSWQSKEVLHQHAYLTEAIKKQLDKIAIKDVDDVIKAIDRYTDILNDDKYFYSHVWTLNVFLKQGNGYPEFLDEGKIWVAYNSKKKKKHKEINGRVGTKYVGLG
jgi:hypothetical protein